MRITYTEFVPDPKLRGTTTNLPAHIAQVLIASGQAVDVLFKGYQDRLSSETPQVAVPPTVEWGVQPAATSSFQQDVVIKKDAFGALTYFAEPPADAPASIKKQWEDLKGIDVNASARALEEARHNQSDYDERSKNFKRW